MMIVVCLNGTIILEQPFGSFFEHYPRWRDFVMMLLRHGGNGAVSRLNLLMYIPYPYSVKPSASSCQVASGNCMIRSSLLVLKDFRRGTHNFQCCWWWILSAIIHQLPPKTEYIRIMISHTLYLFVRWPHKVIPIKTVWILGWMDECFIRALIWDHRWKLCW